jgi:predicted methyltransferase
MLMTIHRMGPNKDDQHSIKVFDPSIKGETDRFAYRFVKR